MKLSAALHLLEAGQPVTRTAWTVTAAAAGDTPPMLLLVPGSTITVEPGRPLGDAAPHLVGEQVAYHAHIDYVCRDGMWPWTPTQPDLLADDWIPVP